MTAIENFKQELNRHAKAGGEFLRTDFHVHLPGFDDYEYKSDDCSEKLGQAINDLGIRLAVVLRHESFPTKEQLAELGKHCRRTTLIPGAEINVFVDVMDRKVSKDHFFHCIVAADPESDFGYLMHKAKENLSFKGSEYPSGFHSSIVDVANFFTNEGALFIRAHLHQNVSPDRSRSIDDVYDDHAFLSFVQGGAFSALEVREKSTATFFDGSKSTRDGTPIPKAVCVRSSDAHSHEHMLVRDRSTWVQMENPTFEELKSSIRFPHRVRLDEPSFEHSRILGVHVVGTFLADEWVAFSPSINCLIGCKGSGKTSVLEILRFALNTEVPKERKESVQKHLDHILGPSGYVECLVRDADGDEFLITRRADSSERITITGEDGLSREISTRENSPFDVAILGWHEIEAVADHANARVRLLDRIEGEATVRERYELINQHVESARDMLPALQRKIKRLDESLKRLWQLEKKRDLLKKLEDGDLLELQTKYEKFLAAEQGLVSLATRIQNAREKSQRTIKSQYAFVSSSTEDAVNKCVSVGVEGDLMGQSLADLDKAVSATEQSLANSSSLVTERINMAVVSVQNAFAEFRQREYEPRVNSLPPDEREVLTRQIQIIEETKNLSQVKSKCEELQAEVQRMASEVHEHCDTICKSRDKVCEIRTNNIQRLNEELPTIRMQFNRSADHAKRDRFQKSYRDDAGKFFGFVDQYSGNVPYEKLRSLFSELAALEIDQSSWKTRDLFWDAKFVELLNVVDDDDVQISMEVGEAGFVPIQNLSAGQRCTAVFPLLLRNTRGPLVIDQPEDNLDNRYIADKIAPDLLSKKRTQQFIATSHNANLVVLTDSDLIVHADSDGRTGEFVARGFFGAPGNAIGRSVLDVLDGGKQALLARQRKYGATMPS
ncbi:AAA family ATPase [Roseimaritima ulvae]|uniref:Chromosome segregation protein n=1 Tax=Roseimaritima ulvae TaxID=980254 RepID=A0A5B9QKQ5_9BACT|nr:AAA family ATPase [Roseimaritima ulvae]QEG39474.1 chromosome segregation protein [Roseimaritima ulvae]